MSSPLCCCEYVDQHGERSHVLACCCNCSELDYCFERLITCKAVPPELVPRLMMTVNDRLRIPWKSGAKRLRFESVIVLLLLPLVLIIAAQGVWMSVIVFTFLPLFLVYTHFLLMKICPQSQFFIYWNIASTLVVFVIFEFVAFHLLEIRFDENAVFILLSLVVLVCLYKVKSRETLSAVSSDVDGDLEGLVDGMCTACDARPPPRAYHCPICQFCVLKRNQHCAWFNCCIGQNNHFWYMMFLISNFTLLLLCSNLILTTACHPFVVWGSVMLPDDCSYIYFDVLYALCFVTAIYCLEAACFVGAILLHESWLISLGITGHEYRLGSNRKFCWGLFMHRPYSRGIIRNWYYFWRGIDRPHGAARKI